MTTLPSAIKKKLMTLHDKKGLTFTQLNFIWKNLKPCFPKLSKKATNAIVTRSLRMRRTIDSFDAHCRHEEYTDSDALWTLVRLCRDSFNDFLPVSQRHEPPFTD